MPSPHAHAPLRVMFFCLGNICRSPLAEAVFRHQVAQRGLAERFVVASSGTSDYHVGEAPDPGSQRVARERLGLDMSHQRAQQLQPAHLRECDVLVAMSASNIKNARRLDGGREATIALLRDWEPSAALQGLDVPDPWGYGSDAFAEVFEIVERCCARLLDDLIHEPPRPF